MIKNYNYNYEFNVLTFELDGKKYKFAGISPYQNQILKKRGEKYILKMFKINEEYDIEHPGKFYLELFNKVKNKQSLITPTLFPNIQYSNSSNASVSENKKRKISESLKKIISKEFFFTKLIDLKTRNMSVSIFKNDKFIGDYKISSINFQNGLVSLDGNIKMILDFKGIKAPFLKDGEIGYLSKSNDYVELKANNRPKSQGPSKIQESSKYTKYLIELAYTNNLGIHELMIFYNKAPIPIIQKFEMLMKQNNFKSAFRLVEKITGVKLQNIV